MELEEGTTQWIGHATTVLAGLTSLAQQRRSYGGRQAEMFYILGPLQLWVIEGLAGPEEMRRITRGIARSTGPDGGVFAHFVDHVRNAVR
jgi:hypothetical protein